MGDTVLDRDVEGVVERVSPDAPVPVVDVQREVSGAGGAGLAAVLCADRDVDVTLVTPIGGDDAGRELVAHLASRGVDLIPLGQHGPTRQKTRVRAAGQSLLRVDRGGPAHPVDEPPADAVAAVHDADVVLVSCYGAGTSANHVLRHALADRARTRPVVWDPHPRGATPVPSCALVTPNLAEARAEAGLPGAPGDEVARALVGRWSARSVAVTAGEVGAWLAGATGAPLLVPATPRRGDPCGAGDSFAAAAAVAIGTGRTASEAVVTAVAAAGDFVAAGGAAAARGPRTRTPVPGSSLDVGSLEPAALTRRVQAGGGTVVATGGCFDVLHSGHVHSLQAARRLGDALVVLLNSDASVRRLKGPGRPIHPAADRARVLAALACVDAVVVFDEDDPRDCLQLLRPDVWVKGGDYEGADLPEAGLVASWGGRVVLLPYLSGRSTTRVLEVSADRG